MGSGSGACGSGTGHGEELMMQLHNLRNQQRCFIIYDDVVCLFHFFFFRHLVSDDGLYLFFGALRITLQHALYSQGLGSMDHDNFV